MCPPIVSHPRRAKQLAIRPKTARPVYKHAGNLEQNMLPALEHYCGSWIVTRRTGEVIGEFFDRRNVERFNPATCLIETAAQYLGRVNAEIRAADKQGTKSRHHI